MRVHGRKHPSWFGATLNEDEIAEWRQKWPASGLHNLRWVQFEFDKRNGDLVDSECNGKHRSCEPFDGPALAALANDAQCAAAKKLKLDTSDHCRNTEGGIFLRGGPSSGKLIPSLPWAPGKGKTWGMKQSKLPYTIRVGANCRVTIKAKPETDEFAILAYVGRQLVADSYDDRRMVDLRYMRDNAAATVRWLRKQPQCRR